VNETASKTKNTPENDENSFRKTFRILKNLFGFGGVLFSWFTAMITLFLIGPSFVILYYLDGYKPATFTIEKLTYIQGQYHSSVAKRSYDKYWADGTVDGQKEKFTLGAYIKGAINNQEELDVQLKVGQKLPVYYNPEVPEKHELRILYPDENFYEIRKLRKDKFIRTGYLPLFALWGLCLLCGILAQKKVSAVRFVFGSLFFVAVAWGFVLLKYYI